MIIASMVDFAKTNPKEEFYFAFNGTEYYKEVLEKCKQEKIPIVNIAGDTLTESKIPSVAPHSHMIGRLAATL